jgi:large subunit ribosomal protein L25
MKSFKIEGTLRSELGKKATRQLRSEGMVPGVIYGKENTHFSASQMAFRNLVFTPNFQIAEITVDGKTHNCILKDLQFDVLTDELSHIDFLELQDDRKVIANLPLKFTGTSEGVKAGGRFVPKMNTIKVRTYPKYLVEAIEVSIDKLEIGGNIRVEDVKAENMEIMNSPRIPVASVVTTRALRQAETEDAKTAKK